MAAQVIPMRREASSDSRRDWRRLFFEFLDVQLDTIEKECSMDDLGDITSAILQRRSEILGQLVLGLVNKRYAALLEQEYCACPRCSKQIKSRGKHKRELETLVGKFSVERPYFYCIGCGQGFYPLDEALALSPSPKQYDIQDLGAWLASELPFETASEAYQRCTGDTLSGHHFHDCANRIAQELGILDVCPSKEQIFAKIAEISWGKRRRPVMMLAIDGAHAPTRPEPSPRTGKRGKGEWKEVKGFRLYLIGSDRIEHLISWHQVGSDQELAQALQIVKDAGLIPEDKVRLCLIGDGAQWIGNRAQEIFPTAKQVLDFYHCSEHLHDVADAQYGKGTRDAQEWVEAFLTRLFHNQKEDALAGIRTMTPSSDEAKKKIENLIGYLTKHHQRLDYGTAKRGGYNIGSGGIESANKFISHVRLKRSGAWWYPTNANNILKLRCAKYNGTYDNIIQKYKKREQERLTQSKRAASPKKESDID